MKKIIAVLMVILMGILTSCSALQDMNGFQGIQGEKGEDGKDGVDGKDGIDGKDGVDGVDGKDGASLLVGNGVPAADFGLVGDSYIDLDSWDFYHKTTDGWSAVGNIRGEDGKENSATNDPLNGEYGLHHIVVESISTGDKSTYNVGDTYLGLVMSSSTIRVTLNNGKGTMTYDFGSVVTTNITYEVVDDKFIMTCEDAVDILYGYPEHRYEMAIDEIDEKVCFVLTVTSAHSIYTYYVVALK